MDPVKIMEIFNEEFTTDDESWEKKGEHILSHKDKWDKDTADDVFITLCGWSLDTILEKAGMA